MESSKIKTGIVVIFPPDLMKIFPHITSYSGAAKRYRAIKNYFEKEKHQYLTLEEFSEYEDIPIDRIRQAIGR